ncbi:hypothetical protein CYLTODRAFT_423042 [Cylindrobasidium torrendii FP15055 ss-10]|uniref:Metallo-beta-lactamase domain-containing protein n=1 Tax=Cylindrobasidium torrendii FP15055 ss-10 TaxID=1314674 RepID=A0A0D7B9I1_9AGAR|nr:hypothetical protein CYLTODRAFT_423042 [Cylindrobasidium torrendii FP15055 ss-10]
MSVDLRKVQNLKITFLVDNSIEWFTKLPAGFSSELKQHLTGHHHAMDPVTNTPLIDLDNYCCGAHGFGALIETRVDEASSPQYTLFDTGPDRFSLVRNLKSVQINTAKISRVITSHWHSDHTGGLLSFLDYRNEQGAKTAVVVDCHPDRPFQRGIAPGPNYDKVIGALARDPEFDAMQSRGAVVDKHAEAHVVAGGGVYVSGEIPRVTSYEQGIPGARRWNEQKALWEDEEHIMDERYAAIDVLGKGLVIFSACSHAGIVNVIKHAVDTFSRPIYMIVGGLHLATPDLIERIAPTVKFLSETLRPSPTYILPMHCSGFPAKIALESAFGEGCIPAGVGMSVDLQGNEEHEARLFPAKY